MHGQDLREATAKAAQKASQGRATGASSGWGRVARETNYQTVG